MAMRFYDRAEAGHLLALNLKAYANRSDVLALPRGGVPVAFAVAQALNAPLDIFLVRKLGVPDQPELAMGAIASGGVRVLNNEMIWTLHVTPEEIDRITAKEQQELERRERLYRGDRSPLVVHNHTVILIDDGLATGSTMRAAIAALRQQQPARIVVAVPVAAPEVCNELRAEVDEIVCFMMPEPFFAVGLWYEDFSETTDDEVRNLLDLSRDRRTHAVR